MSTRARARYELTAEDKSKRAFNSFRGSISGTVKMMGGLKGALLAITGGAGLGMMIKQTLDAGDQIQKMSIRLGASTEALSQLRHVAKLSGIEFNTLTMGFQRMTRRIAEAAVGTGEARGALKELGLDARVMAQLAPEEQFYRIADAMKGVGSSSDKVRLAMKLFDSEGVSLIQTMTGGAEGIREMMAEADRLGLTLNRLEADSMAAANDALTRMRGSVSGLANTLTIQLAPTIANLADSLTGVLPGAIKVALGAFNVMRLAVISLFIGMAKMAEKTFSLFGKLPGRMGAKFREMAGTAGNVAGSLVGTATGFADQILGAQSSKAPQSKAPGEASPSAALGPAAPDTKNLNSFLKWMEGDSKVGAGRQINMDREALGAIGEKKTTIVEGPVLERIAVLLEAIKLETQRGGVVGA